MASFSARSGIGRGTRKLGLAAAVFAAATAGVVTVPAAPALAACGSPAAYASNFGDNTVSVIDNCAQVIATIPVGAEPFALAVRPGGADVYVANYSDGTVSVIDAATRQVIATIGLGSGTFPDDIAINWNGSAAYVADRGGYVGVVDTASNMWRATVVTPGQPNAVAVSPDGFTVYAAAADPNGPGPDALYLIDAGTLQVTRTFQIGVDTMSLAVSPDGSTIYGAMQNDGTIDVIDAATGLIERVIDAGDAFPLGNIALSPDGGTLYAAEGSQNRLSFIDAASGIQETSVPLVGDGPGMALSSDGAFAYTNIAANGPAVAKVNTNSGQVTDTIPVGADSIDVATVPSAPTEHRRVGWLHGLWCATGGFCLAVGTREVPDGVTGLSLVRAGGRWRATGPLDLAGTADDTVYQVACRSRTDCVAVGGADSRPAAGGPVTAVPLAAAWNGTRWTASQPPTPPGTQGAELRDVSCSGRTCLAVGSYRNDGGMTMPLSELWSHGRWHLLATPDAPGGITARLTSISCRRRACAAAGAYKGARTGWRPLAESWNGSRWQAQPMPAPRGQFPVAQGISCAAPGRCLAVGYAVRGARAIPFTDQLAHGRWRLLATAHGEPRNAQLDSVSCPTVNRCIATGGLIRAGKQSPLAQQWNGTTWRALPIHGPASATLSILDHLSCTTPRSCLAVGNNGTRTLAESWNGTRWQQLSTPRQ